VRRTRGNEPTFVAVLLTSKLTAYRLVQYFRYVLRRKDHGEGKH